MLTPDTLLSLAIADYRAGALAAGEVKFRAFLRHRPTHVMALNILAIMCLRSERFDESIALIETALKSKPEDHQALANLALAKHKIGDLKGAIRHLEKSLSIVPKNINALNSLGSLHRDTGAINQAQRCYRGALAIDPEHVDSLLNSAIVERAQGNFNDALQHALKAVQIAPERAEVSYQVASSYTAIADYPKAIEWYQKSLQKNSAQIDTWIGLIDVLREAGRVEACQQTIDALRKRMPACQQTHFAQGLLDQQCGNPSGAAEQFSQAIAAQPTWSKAHYYRLQLKGRVSVPSELAQIDGLPHTGHFESDVYRHFALATAHQQRGDRDMAFEAWLAGNALKARQGSFDVSLRKNLYQAAADHTRQALDATVEMPAAANWRPLFIVGMPRSGTTLAGQILSSHSQINGLGETSAVHNMTLRAVASTGRPYPEAIEALTQDDLRAFAEALLAEYETDRARLCTLDVTPTNFQHLGLLALALPHARFIHCCRNPIDTCFSIFKLPFPQGQDYAHDLRYLGQQYRAYWQLMQQWKVLFGERIYSLHYENIVVDSEAQIGLLCDFLDLPFESSMLQFYTAKNLVRTPSASQVRQPLYSNSVAAWRPYSDHLKPLLTALGDLAKT